MKIESRILLSIRQRPGVVILRSDVAGLGSASQVSASLKALQNKGLVVRVGSGIYAKSVKDPATGVIRLMASAENIAVEVFQKMGVAAHITPSGASKPLQEMLHTTRKRSRLTRKGRTQYRQSGHGPPKAVLIFLNGKPIFQSRQLTL